MKTETKEITIPRMNIKRMVVEIESKPGSSLIMHRFGEKARKQIADKQGGKAKGPKSKRIPKRDYEEAKYFDADGDLALPSVMFKGAVLDAAAGLENSTKRGTSRAIFFVGEYVKIRGKEHMREDYARIAHGGTTLVYRPEFDEWEATLEVEYNADILTAEQVVNLINYGGFACGVGDWRPGSKMNFTGEHGRFRVKT